MYLYRIYIVDLYSWAFLSTNIVLKSSLFLLYGHFGHTSCHFQGYFIRELSLKNVEMRKIGLKQSGKQNHASVIGFTIITSNTYV